jgi:CubicO group peptidase (beta-lactamase class C family)
LAGLGIALVRNGSVWYKGYGHARLDPPVAFDEFTVSNIGSTGKAFTVALLGILITEARRKGERYYSSCLY